MLRPRLVSAVLIGAALIFLAPAPARHTGLAAESTIVLPATPAATVTPTPVPSNLPKHYVVLIVVDGGRPALFSQLKLPHIQALMRQGVVYDRAYVGEMESVTPNVHVTFGTGTLPKENGFLGFSWVSPVDRKSVDFRTLLANGQIDPILKSLPVASVAARLHSQIPGAVAVAASGHKDYAAVGLGGGSADYVIYGHFTASEFMPTFLPGHTPPPLSAAETKSLTIPKTLPTGVEDAWGLRYASIVAAKVKPRLLLINLPEMDTSGHWNGTNDPKISTALMQNIDRGVGEIEDVYRKLGILSQTDFIITADHAMMQSRPATNWGAVENTAAKAEGAPLARADGDGGAIWLHDPTKAKAAADAIVRSKPAHVDAVFYRSAMGTDFHYVMASPDSWLVKPAVGTALSDLVDTTAGLHGPDVWVLYRENYTVVPRNVSGLWKGTHGGATWKVQHVPWIMSGPGIRQGAHSQFPARAIDIAPTMERLLGLPPVKRDGVTLADALTDPLADETKAQQAVEPRVAADAQALQDQSTTDTWAEQPGNWKAPPPQIIYRCATHKERCQTKSLPPTNS